jgi:hypothetical protein
MWSENFENILHKHYNEHEYERAERAVFAPWSKILFVFKRFRVESFIWKQQVEYKDDMFGGAEVIFGESIWLVYIFVQTIV